MGAVKAAIADIDQLEAEAESAPVVFSDLIPFMIPGPTYRALSDRAAQRNTTVALFLAEVLSRALEEDK